MQIKQRIRQARKFLDQSLHSIEQSLHSPEMTSAATFFLSTAAAVCMMASTLPSGEGGFCQSDQFESMAHGASIEHVHTGCHEQNHFFRTAAEAFEEESHGDEDKNKDKDE